VDQCTESAAHDLIVIEMLVVLGCATRVAADLGLSETAVAGVSSRARAMAEGRPLGPHEWQEADLARTARSAASGTRKASCLKRSLGRYLLGVLDEDWNAYIDFHVQQADCDRCQANWRICAAKTSARGVARRLR
jgi:hypothetical protein